MLVEDGAGSHEYVRAGRGAARGCLHRDAAVHFDLGAKAALVDQSAQAGDLRQRAFDEPLTGGARVHRHHHHLFDVRQYLFDSTDGRPGVEADAGPLLAPVHLPDDAVKVRRCFDVDIYHVAPRVNERRGLLLRLHDHQMDVQDKARDAPDRLDYRQPDANRRHEPPVHHVNVDVVRARSLAFLHLLAQPRKVRRENGRRELNPVDQATSLSRSPAARSASVTRGGAVPPGTSRAAIEAWTSSVSTSSSNNGEKRRYSSNESPLSAFPSPSA